MLLPLIVWGGIILSIVAATFWCMFEKVQEFDKESEIVKTACKEEVDLEKEKNTTFIFKHRENRTHYCWPMSYYSFMQIQNI